MGRRINPRYNELPPEQKHALERMYVENVKLAYSAVNKFIRKYNFEYLRDDLEREALYSLWKAVLGFKKEKNYALSTYLCRFVMRNLRYEVTKLTTPYHIPSYTTKKLMEEGRIPYTIHLEQEKWRTVGAVDNSVDSELINQEQYARVRDAITKLPTLERQVIKARFGFDSTRKTDDTLTKELNVCRHTLQAIRRRALNMLKYYLTEET